MNSLPNIAIGLVTYERTAMALQTILSTITNLQYPKENIGWYVADDGSRPEHMKAIIDLLETEGQRIIGQHSQRMRHQGHENTHNAGLGWNKCLGICHQFSDYVLWLEDDWDLTEPLDILPYVQLLQNREDIGICTFRILTTGADIHTEGYAGQMYFRYHRTTQYAFSGNPYLRHARYTTRYGWFAEDRNPGLMELHMDDQYRLAMEGPTIWRPVQISQWGAWKHIGSTKTWR